MFRSFILTLMVSGFTVGECVAAGGGIGSVGVVGGNYGGSVTSRNYGGSVTSRNYGGSVTSRNYGGSATSRNYGGGIFDENYGLRDIYGNFGTSNTTGLNYGSGIVNRNYGRAITNQNYAGSGVGGNYGGGGVGGNTGAGGFLIPNFSNGSLASSTSNATNSGSSTSTTGTSSNSNAVTSSTTNTGTSSTTNSGNTSTTNGVTTSSGSANQSLTTTTGTKKLSIDIDGVAFYTGVDPATGLLPFGYHNSSGYPIFGVWGGFGGDVSYANGFGTNTRMTRQAAPQPVARARRGSEPPPPLALVSNQYPATLSLQLPAVGEVWVNGTKGGSSATNEYTLTSPNLKPGQEFTFDVTARWAVDGKTFEFKRTVSLTGGNLSRVTVVAGTEVETGSVSSN